MICLICQEKIVEKERFLNILFLKKNSRAVCPLCYEQFVKIVSPCPNCYKNEQDRICQDCIDWQQKKYQVNHNAIFQYNEAMKDYFSKYKFQGDYQLRSVFVKELKNRLKEYKDFTIVPVPVSQERMKERGFNQVTAILDSAKIPYKDILKRSDQKRQSSKNKAERLQTRSPFSLKNGTKLPDQVLVVDDIYTTGTTLHHISKLLFKKKVKNVKTLSIAR